MPRDAIQIDGAKMRRLRRERALSQRNLAALSGVSLDAVSQQETGKRRAAPSTVRKLATALGVEPGDLIKGE